MADTPEPEWQEPGACTRVIFHPHPEVHRAEIPNGPINDPVKNHDLNARQQWFVMQFDVGHKVNAADIVAEWGVAEKTAKRDIAALRERELIEFVGAPKTGCYQMKRTDEDGVG